MKRRTFLRTGAASAVGLTGLAGCLGGTGTSGTLRIATYESFVGEGAAGTWLKQEFEAAHPEVTVEFEIPEAGINEYIRRKQEGAPIDADLYVGLNTGELVRVDRALEERLFDYVKSDLENDDHILEELRIDPQGRALPYDTGYISLVYDENAIDAPKTFDALLADRYEGDLLTENAQQSDPGRAFLLWTIIAKGANGYLDYWRGLLENDVRILSDWSAAYNAYTNEEAPMVVSYSTDQVYWYESKEDLSRHQIGFLNDQGYANPEAMARFAGSDRSELAARFMDFVLSKRAQSAIARRNVQFPATDWAEMSETFQKYAYKPPEPVTFTYEELAGNLNEWVEAWAREVATK